MMSKKDKKSGWWVRKIRKIDKCISDISIQIDNDNIQYYKHLIQYIFQVLYKKWQLKNTHV